MAGFNKDFILEKIAEMEDIEHSMSAVYTKENIAEDAPEDLQGLVELTGKVVDMDYADLGENGYDAYGIFCFLPDVEEDPCRDLSVVITLSDDVNEVGLYDLYQVMNRINARIPEGAFVISDDEKTLYYKNNVTLKIEEEDEETLHNVGIRVFNAVAIVAGWIDVLMGLNDGTLDYEECIRRLQPVG